MLRHGSHTRLGARAKALCAVSVVLATTLGPALTSHASVAPPVITGPGEIGMEEIADAPPEELDREEIIALIESALTIGEDGDGAARPAAEPMGMTT